MQFNNRWWQQVDTFLLLRFFAALLVVRQHLDFRYPDFYLFGKDFGWIFFGDIGSGSSAVICFFTLSGYLMGKKLLSKEQTFDIGGFWDFYLARFRRIVPLYLFVVTVSLFTIWHYILDISKQSTLYYLLKIFTFQFDRSFSFNSPIWTIGTELTFYLFAPILACFVINLIKIPRTQTLFISLFILSTILLLLHPIVPSFIPLISVVTFLQYSGVFLIGFSVALALRYSRIPSWINIFAKKTNLFIPLSILALVMMFRWGKLTSYEVPFFHIINLRTICVTVFTSIFIFIKEVKENQVYTKSKNIINHLGELSYGLYLIHIIFVELAHLTITKYINTVFGRVGGGYLLFFIVTFCSLLAAQILFIYVEKPASLYLKRFNYTNIRTLYLTYKKKFEFVKST